jgi:NAD(P)H-nitrite reductase large subunit
MIYGLVAPGYAMAETVAKNIVGIDESSSTEFLGADMSTKLKLMGVDVASFGVYNGPDSLVWNDPFTGVYKKLFFNAEGTRLLGGILVGDAADYAQLLGLVKADKDLTVSPAELLIGSTVIKTGSGGAPVEMSDDMQICSCNDVSKGAVVNAVKTGGCTTMAAVKSSTKVHSTAYMLVHVHIHLHTCVSSMRLFVLLLSSLMMYLHTFS